MTDAEDRTTGRHAAVNGWSTAGDFFGSIIAGLGLGLGADWLLDTAPWFAVIGGIAGFGVGFWRMFVWSDQIFEDIESSGQARRREFAEELRRQTGQHER